MEKLQWRGYPTVQNFVDMITRDACDRRTDNIARRNIGRAA